MITNKIFLKSAYAGDFEQIKRIRLERIAIDKHNRSQEWRQTFKEWTKAIFKGAIIVMFLYLLRQYQLSSFTFGILS